MILKTDFSSLSALAKANLVTFLTDLFEKMHFLLRSAKCFCLLLNLERQAIGAKKIKINTCVTNVTSEMVSLSVIRLSVIYF